MIGGIEIIVMHDEDLESELSQPDRVHQILHLHPSHDSSKPNYLNA